MSRKPTRHPNNSKHWYGYVGRDKARRIVNLQVLLTEPEHVAQVELDRLNAEWDAKHCQPATTRPAPARRRLVDLFEQYKAAKDIHYRNSRRGFQHAADRVRKVIVACQFKYVADIDGQKILQYLHDRMESESNFSAATAEHYRRDFKWFCNWLREQGYLDRGVFGRRDRIKGDLVHRRRVMAPGEQDRLLAATLAFKGRRKIPNKVRQLIYWVALRTGFRSGELKALTVGCLADSSLKLDGKWTKNGEDADQPLPDDLAAALVDYCRDRPPDQPLFPTWDRGANMLRKDLRAAGIPYVTADGCVDFHALRNTYCTDLAQTGCDIKTAHLLMRHKSIEMTLSYMRTDAGRKADAVRKLAHRPVELPEVIRGGAVEFSDGGPLWSERLVELFGTDRIDNLELLVS